ncbi:MAG: 50S ribosomal protein L25 [Anaerolineae bacterium]
MEAIELHAEPRKLTGKKVKLLRQQNIIPGIIYGRHVDPIAVQFDHRELAQALGQAGTSATVLVDVAGGDEPYLAIFRDVQHHPIRRRISHVDLQALSLTETVRVPVNVVIVGEAPAAVEEGGVLMQLLTELDIEALPTSLIPAIEVDVSGLTEIGMGVTIGDIPVPDGVTILNAPDETIVQVTYMAEEELEVEEPTPLETELGLLGEPTEVAEEVEGEEGEIEEEPEEF